MQDRFKFKVKFEINGQVEIFDAIDISFESQQVFFRRQDGMVYNIGLGVKDAKLIQCTGLKDKHGKLIFEGDIVRSNEYPFMSEEQDNYYAKICWDDESAGFFYYTFKNPKFNDVRGISTGNTGNLDEHEWEVIGNIYENPELLK